MSTPSDHAHRLNSKITHLIRRIRHIDESQGVGRAKLSALAVLHFSGPRSLTELARAELVTPTTMHHIIKGLLNDKLVRKIPDPTDKRRQEIRLTPKGEKVIVKAHIARLTFLDSLLVGQPTRRITEAIALLEAMDQK
ncbi:MAG: MarR family transcriptional regulator [Gammaproteobacteria bacterium]|nr:MarR family transcriptional regulator [Gammaproteobacteria bacterium]